MNGESLGLAYGLRDVAEFLRRAGLEIDLAEVDQLRALERLDPGDECLRAVCHDNRAEMFGL